MTAQDVPPLEDYVAHYGVKGMHWGVRTGGSSGGSSTPRKRKPSTGSAGATPRRSKAEMAMLAEKRKARIQVGKQVLKAVLIAVGTVAIASMAGPIVAAGAGAIARALPGDAFGVTTTTREVSNQPGTSGFRVNTESRSSDGGVSRTSQYVEGIRVAPRR